MAGDVEMVGLGRLLPKDCMWLGAGSKFPPLLRWLWRKGSVILTGGVSLVGLLNEEFLSTSPAGRRVLNEVCRSPPPGLKELKDA